MNQQGHSNEGLSTSAKRLEARYAYYRRCQVFRKNGEQCKAPAEKGASICHAHAGQQAMAFRRDLERRIVLGEAVAEMRRQGKRDCDMTNLFMDFKGIQVTLAVMAQALIAGRIDCKTAGRLLVDLQTVSKLLRMHHKGTKNLPRINTNSTDLQNRAMAGNSNLPIEARRPPSHQARTGLAGDYEEAMNARTKNTKVVAIRSTKQAPNPSRIFYRQGSRPTLLTG